MGTQTHPSPIFYFWGHPLPCTPPPSWISNRLITSPILKSAGQAIIQALLMTPSAKVSIRQVGIRRAENRAGQRAEHKSVLVQVTYMSTRAPSSLKATANALNSPVKPQTKTLLHKYPLPCPLSHPLTGLQLLTSNHSGYAGKGPRFTRSGQSYSCGWGLTSREGMLPRSLF